MGFTKEALMEEQDRLWQEEAQKHNQMCRDCGEDFHDMTANVSGEEYRSDKDLIILQDSGEPRPLPARYLNAIALYVGTCDECEVQASKRRDL